MFQACEEGEVEKVHHFLIETPSSKDWVYSRVRERERKKRREREKRKRERKRERKKERKKESK